MGFLTEVAEKSAKKASRRAHVPEWMALAPIAGTALAGIILLVAFVLPSGGNSEGAIAGPGGISYVPSNTAEETPAGSTATTPGANTPGVTATVPTTNRVSVEKTDGGTIDIDAAALAVAKQAAVAIWTGNWEDIPVDGTPGGEDSSSYPDAQLSSLKVRTVDPTLIAFVADIDVDGDGSADSSTSVNVQKQSNGWVFIVVGL